jgi:hypothetical protein
VQARVRLLIADKDGVTARDRLLAERARARAAGADTAELDAKLREPRLPPAGRHLWDWFWQLDATRGAGMAVQRITYCEMEAWARLTRQAPMPVEIEMIMAMDVARLTAAREKPPAMTSESLRDAFLGVAPPKRRAAFERMQADD